MKIHMGCAMVLLMASLGWGQAAPTGAELELACWNMLPATSARVNDLAAQVDRLRAAAPKSPWLGVYRLYLAAQRNDRGAMIAAADLVPPENFPYVSAEADTFKDLVASGLTRTQAGLKILGTRSYDPLHALLDLDQALTREAQFLRQARQVEPANKLLAARDRLREAYLKCSRHVVERCFALNLLGRHNESIALAERAKTIRWLNDAQALRSVLAATSGDEAWEKVVSPLLRSEVEVVQAPPILSDAPAGAPPLVVEAKNVTTAQGIKVYTGNVRVTAGEVKLACEQLAVVSQGDSAQLSGEKLEIRGLLASGQTITARSFTFNAQAGEFSLSGSVRVGASKSRLCIIDRQGRITFQRTLLDDLREAKDGLDKFRIGQQILAEYEDRELAGEARYWAAMALVRPHLTWHAPYPPGQKVQEMMKEEVKRLRETEEDLRWGAAHPGDDWMQEDARRALGEAAFASPEAKPFWRLKDPNHADIRRAIALLIEVNDQPLHARARHWYEELRRNNTVITFDIAGGYAPNAPGPVVMDVRSAEKVSFKVYRIRQGSALLAIADRVGEDFIFEDYGLGQAEMAKRLQKAQELMRMRQAVARHARPHLPLLDPADLVAQWESPVAPLIVLPNSPWIHEENDWDDDDYHDNEYDDRCEYLRARLEKTYLRDTASSWQGDRIVEIPREALKEPGAYVLVAQANGQTAHAPILVDPLSMTLRRCRDGVFVLVSDNTGLEPAAGAVVHAVDMLGQCVADGQGAAFARMYAGGDRPIVAEKNGRFAIGGFGRIFEGIYHSKMDRDMHRMRWQRALRQKADRLQTAAQVYADRFVVAAYTDRPTYRPGQEVQFKLILRKLREVKRAGGFRDEDFEPGSNLELPAPRAALRYDVVNAKGRVVGAGELALSEFGTAAGSVMLSPEEATGACSIRVWLDGAQRIVPDVFAVKFYRRPNFELKLAGVPAKLQAGQNLKVELSADYYFRKPVAGGQVEVRLVRPDQWRPIATASGALDAAGKRSVELALPENLAPGEYHVIAGVTDESGRTVSRSIPTQFIDPAAVKPARGLTTLARFAAVDEVLTVQSDQPVVAAQRAVRSEFAPKNGSVQLKLSRTGWHTLSCGADRTELFIYGSGAKLHDPDDDADNDDDKPGRWIRLDKADDEDRDEWDYRRDELHVLFDRQHAKVGDKLRVLVHLPCEKSRLVFTMEGRTVIDYFVTTVSDKSGFALVEIPIRARHAPNFYLQGRVIAAEKAIREKVDHAVRELRKMEQAKLQEIDEGTDPRWCRVDVLTGPEAPGGQKLAVQVTTDRATYQPGQEVNVAVKITDPSGKPVEAEFSLAGVDESIYSFGEDALDSLPRALAARRGATRYLEKTWRTAVGRRSYDGRMMDLAKAAEAMQKAMQQMAQASKMVDALQQVERLEGAPGAIRIDGQRPVTQLELTPLRLDFRETATWQPQLRTGADGKASARFKLPDSLTSYRLTAVVLTRDTQIGVGRASLRASKPVAVQVFLPRFAVEGDRLTAVALVHNNTAQARAGELLWELSGAKTDAPLRVAIHIPANGSARCELPLEMQQAGEMSLAVRALAGGDADGERRALRIEALGRAREVTLGGAMQRSAKLQLPAGFVASDLTITLTRKDPAAAMEGLGYLIDYPYGCVEQTMSRFRPAIAISHAAGKIQLDLPPETRAKLPEVLARGLARIYNFQHADGGWGWWEKDATNDNMTLYVMDGLVRCRAAGTSVDPGVIERGCTFLKSMLDRPRLDREQAARVHLILAMAGQADVPRLATLANESLTSGSAHSRAILALACREAGKADLARRLWRACENGVAQDTMGLALMLETQLAFREPLEKCYQTSYALLDRRQGPRWENTHATAAAIEALASMLQYSAGSPHARRVQAKIGDQVVLDESDPKNLGAVSYRVRRAGRDLPLREAMPIELTIDCDQPVQYAIAASGTQRLDRLEETGGIIRLKRRLTTLDGQPIPGPVKVGQVIAVHLMVELGAARQYVMVEDRRPAGMEFADELVRGARTDHAEFRDDRVLMFFTNLSAGRHELTYYLRAETPGLSHMLPGCAYPMYEEKTRGDSAADMVEVTR